MSRVNEALCKQLIKSKTTTQSAANTKPELKSKDTNKTTSLLGRPQQTGNIEKSQILKVRF